MRWKSHGVVGALVALGCVDPAVPEAAPADDTAAGLRLDEEPMPRPMLDRELVARAPIDECVATVGFSGMEPPCEPGTRPKINETVLTMAARSGDYAYFGTVANAPCLGSASLLGPLPPFETDDLICEGGAGPSADRLGSPAYGDARPPRILRLNARTDELEDVTPADDPLLRSTIGLHGVGAHQDVVLLAGVNIVEGAKAGANVWALEASTGRVLGSTTLPDQQDLRGGIVVKGELYLGTRDVGEGAGGTIVKWTGDKVDPFRFEVVGELGSAPTSLVEHDGRIAVAGGSGFGMKEAKGEIPGLFLSPVVREGGLTEADKGRWTRIFGIEDYDPDPVVARATSIGGLASYGGRLFFSTEQLPLYATMNAFTAYGRPETWSGRLHTVFVAERASAMFAVDDAGTPTERVTLLYGEAELPAFDPATGDWKAMPNGLGQEPLYGGAGFGNPHNMATSAVTEFQGRLYVATFDASALGGLLAPIFAQPSVLDLPDEAVALLEALMTDAPKTGVGGDLWRIDGPYQPAVPEEIDGYGNPSNVGMRMLVPFEDQGKLYGGTANPFNLRTEDAPGGWELLKFTPKAEEPAPPR